ncbi:6-phosphofructokinase [Mycoplasma iguanae]|uniref:ATP-dependent 6-phosphofructokinase n=1 Tax=Mycoplasma iguanae TaxID=292461 RepID=A0ABY5RAL6_9MOLU|nr:6-phosphofructokinase [Mycoplasma iguanae]UVD81819.1 6-phosphofructokinase [Mycoplasma iguanae]
MSTIKKIAVLTSGGDAPGMNNAIRAVLKHALANNLETFLIYEGYKGLVEKNIQNAKNVDVDQYIAKGGTFIYSARYPEFKDPAVRMQAKQNLLDLEIDALVVIGGDGSYMGAQLLHEIGVKTITMPGTIDNDITSSDFTIGYDTALNTIVKAVDSLRDTSNSHNRFLILEVMGHGAGDLALYSGLATGAEIIITNEAIKTTEEIVAIVKDQMIAKKKRSVIAIVSEFIYEDIKALAKEVEAQTGIASRAMALEHVQRGGTPTAQERIQSTLMGIKAVDLLLNGQSGVALGNIKNDIIATPILEALAMKNKSNKEKTEKFNKLNQS